ncbi:MAG: phage Gp37/Gp68 family protein [Acholeplasmataceae bacterium]|jgi:protein gp37|nr:phage Gp37/Gp68 family protein [Acholeplasmataceae bacterium]
MNKTSIEWTENTWNPITGCTQVSDGCKNCYAKRMAKRLEAMGNPRYVNGFKLTIHEDLFIQPLLKKKSQVIFVCSMSDLFHEDVSLDIIDQLFDIMEMSTQHIFQVLTKRSHRLLEYSQRRHIPDNVWVGVSLESEKVIHRLHDLNSTIAKTKFLSCEPLLSDIETCDFKDIDWVVVGGESGPYAREIKEEWVINIRDNCQRQGVKFFFKQWGGVNKKKNGRLLEGKIYDDMPEVNY